MEYGRAQYLRDRRADESFSAWVDRKYWEGRSDLLTEHFMAQVSSPAIIVKKR